MRAAVVRDSDGFVVNVIEVEDMTFPVDLGHTLREAQDAGPGSTWNGTTFDRPPGPTLADLKDVKASEFIAEGVTRIAAQVPDLDTLSSIKAVAAIWPEIGAGARAVLATAKDIYLYVRDTAPAKLAVVTSQVELDTIDPTAADPFGDGTPWPT